MPSFKIGIPSCRCKFGSVPHLCACLAKWSIDQTLMITLFFPQPETLTEGDPERLCGISNRKGSLNQLRVIKTREKEKRIFFFKGVNTSFINPTRGLPLVDVLYLVLTGMPDVLPYATRAFVVVFTCGVFPALIKLHIDFSPILCQRLSPDMHSPRHSSSFTLHNVFTMRCLTRAVHLQKSADQCTRKSGLQTPFLLLQSTLPALCTHSSSRLRQD